MIRSIRTAIARRRYVLAKRRYHADPSFRNFEAQSILGDRWFQLAFPEAIGSPVEHAFAKLLARDLADW